jgi:hypothetical protein
MAMGGAKWPKYMTFSREISFAFPELRCKECS